MLKTKITTKTEARHSTKLLKFLIIILISSLASCAKLGDTNRDGFPRKTPDISKIPNAKPKIEQISKYGNPKSYVIGKKRYHVMKTSKGYREHGFASWYGTKFHGRRTSSGEKYDMFAMTAAHKFLPIPCYAQITNLDNGKMIIVKINDRGPFHGNRVIDLSYTAAAKLGILGRGTGKVEVLSIDPRDHGGFKLADLSTKNQLKPDYQQIYNLNKIEKIKPSKIKKLYLQLGAFNQRSHAEKLRSKIRTLSQNNPTQISKIQNHNQRDTFKVLVGPFKDPKQAEKLTKKLRLAALPKPIVVQE
ncbi:MAG: septal ring lytic transglycosylase RlpA family protein [Gammaproteobacteria bacterium]